jgi:hypothetical protein
MERSVPVGDFLEETVVLDLSQVTQQPLVLVVSEHGPKRNRDPRSTVDEHGAVTNAWDWGIESGDALGDKDGAVFGFLTTYVLPVEDQVFLVGHSLGPTLDSVTRLMCDEEFGDRVSVLVQQHWPTTWQLLREGAGIPNGFSVGAIKVRTTQDHWFVGGLLRSRRQDVVDVDQSAVDGFRDLAFEVLGDALGYPTNLPGLMDILRSDRRGDQLGTAADLFSGAAEILGHFR